MIRTTITSVAILISSPSVASPPKVVTDIPVTASLVAIVSEGVFEPQVLLGGGGSPHDVSLRPSDAARLSDAEMVVWVGPALTPWLAPRIDTLGTDIFSVPLFEGETPSETVGDDHDHGHGDEFDPHAWLDPRIAADWLSTIANALSQLDPANGPVYAENAEKGRNRLLAVEISIAADLSGVTPSYAVVHDAFGHFERRFGIESAGSLSDIEGRTPGLKAVSELAAAMQSSHTICLLDDSTTSDRLAQSLTERTGARLVPVDILGAGLPPGPDLYERLVLDLAATLSDCAE